MEPRCYQCNTLLADINAACPSCLPNWNRTYASEVPQPDAPVSWEEQRYLDAQATIAALQDTIMQMGGQAAVLAKDAIAAKEQVAALQARVQELEARQHFGACAKCLTNAWRICKEGTPDAVEMKCSNGCTWWLCNYCLSKEQLTQRTAEVEAAQRERDEAAKDRDDWITSWRALQRHNERIEAELERVRDQFADLRKMVAALPKVEGEYLTKEYIEVKVPVLRGTARLSISDELIALLQHRQGMEG